MIFDDIADFLYSLIHEKKKYHEFASNLIKVELSIEKFEILLQLYLKLDSDEKKNLEKLLKIKDESIPFISKMMEKKLTKEETANLNSSIKEIFNILNYCLRLILTSKIHGL